MLEFFRGWKKKVGVVTLTMACVFAAGWVRSEFVRDCVNVRSQSGTVQGLRSNCSNLVWCQIDNLKQVVPIGYVTDTPFPTQELARLIKIERSWCIYGLHAVQGTNPSTDEQIFFLFIPYWYIVLPLTLISAWCLLTRPRTNPATKPEPVDA